MTGHATQGPRPIAILCAIVDDKISELELQESLDELGRLCDTLGIDAVERITQRRDRPEPGNYFGQGRLEDLKDRVESLKEEHKERTICVIADDELSPRQWRTLGESLPGTTIYDRAGVILDIFEQRAQTREAKLQVELARLSYLSPRLRQVKGAGDRQRGGIGGKGAGESQLELRRRQVRDRAIELREEIDRIQEGRRQQRQRRQELRRVAFVGYTNAGKSTLMSALSQSDLYIADQLFATLDTTVRTLSPPTNPPIVLADTVGFVRKLPHDLVASFKSTLEEATEASLLLHVIDASDPTFGVHMKTTQDTLDSIGAGEIDMMLVFNKCDRAEDLAMIKSKWPKAMMISATDASDVARLRMEIIAHFDGALRTEEVSIPHRAGHARALMYEQCEVLSESYDEHGGHYQVRGTPIALEQLQDQLRARGPVLVKW